MPLVPRMTVVECLDYAITCHTSDADHLRDNDRKAEAVDYWIRRAIRASRPRPSYLEPER